MRSMHVVLRFDEERLAPLHRELCESTELEREVVLGGHAVDGVETLSSFVHGEPAAYESLVADREAVREYDVTPAEGGCFVYLRRELDRAGRSMLDSLARDTVVVVPPVEVRSDRTMRLTLVGTPDDLRAVVEAIPDGIATDVRRLGDGVTADPSAPTERQRAALAAARDVGYFEVPRRNGIEAVAAELDCAVSTASELVRRGEARAVGRLLEADATT